MRGDRSPPPDIFKAYDIRGLYGEQIDGELAERIGRAFAHVLGRARGQAGRRAARRARPRHAPERAGARGALPRGPAGGGRARDRRGRGRHRDALLPGRLARAGRRADVHRLAQPQGLHGREARARGRDARCPATPASRTSAARSRRASRRHARAARLRRAARSRRSTCTRSSRRRRCASSTPTRAIGAGAEGRARRRQRDGRPDGRPAARAAEPRADRDLLDARRQLPRPRAQPAAAGEPAADHREGARQRRRPRHRLGRRRRPLLLHRRHRRVRRRRLRHGAARRVAAARREPAARAILYDVRASRAVARHRHGGGRRPHIEPRRPRVLQDAHARGGLAVRRRGLRALLLPRLLLRRLGHDPGAARCSSCSARAGKRMSELLAPYREQYFISGEINTEVTDPPARSRRSPSATPTPARTRLDGISIDYEDWHFNVRPSNTEPLLRLCLESLVSREDMERRRDEVLALIRSPPACALGMPRRGVCPPGYERRRGSEQRGASASARAGRRRRHPPPGDPHAVHGRARERVPDRGLAADARGLRPELGQGAGRARAGAGHARARGSRTSSCW